MKISRLLPLAVAISSSLLASQALSSTIDIPSSFNPVGSGARALGLGGAFIAVADDATAASWNPAGLIQLRKPEVALVLSNSYRKEQVDVGANDRSFGNSTSTNDINYFAISAPCSADTCGKNMVFSVNYQRLYDLTREWEFTVPNTTANSNIAQNYRQEGDIYALGLSASIQLSETLNVGFTLNSWGDIIGENGSTTNIEGREAQNAPGILFNNTDIVSKSEFSGTNFNLGLTWLAYQKGEQKLTIGLIYKSEFDADFDSTINFSNISGELGFPEFDSLFETVINRDTTLTLPSSYGIGLAYQINDALTTSFDLYRTDWESFVQKDNDTGQVFSAITNAPIESTNIDNTFQIRAGAEYRIISQSAAANYIIPIRAGVFYDPIIQDEKNGDSYGVSIGSGLAYETWVFDVAYQYRWGDDLGSTTFREDLDISVSLDEHLLYASAFYRF